MKFEIKKLSGQKIKEITDGINDDLLGVFPFVKAKLEIKTLCRFEYSKINSEILIDNKREILISRIIYYTCEYYKTQKEYKDIQWRLGQDRQFNLNEYYHSVCLAAFTICDILKDYGQVKCGEYKYYVSILPLTELMLYKNEFNYLGDSHIYCGASEKGVEKVRFTSPLKEWIEQTMIRYKSNEFICNSNLNELVLFGLIELESNLKWSNDYSKDMVVLHIGLLCFILTETCNNIKNEYFNLFSRIYTLYFVIND